MSPIKSRLFRLSRLFALCSGMLVLFMVATPAKAQCIAQQEVGSWVNADPNTRSLTRADLRFTCQDQVLNGEPYPPGPPWHMHLWGKCSPTDCDWSEIGADSVTIGSRTYVHAIYHQGFATRYVYADMSLYRPGQLWIWMWTDFADPGRADYESQNWFIRR
jgi:hypothetical protein